MATAIDKDMINIWIAAKDLSPTLLIKSGTPAGSQVLPWKGEITNLGKTGGAPQSEQRVCFGGNQTIDKPRDQFELNFDVNPAVETADRWSTLGLVEDTSNSGIYTTRQLPVDKSVFIEIYDSDSNTYHSYGWNNANITTSDDTWNSEEGQSLSLTMTVAADNAGVANMVYGKVAATALPNWDALDGN